MKRYRVSSAVAVTNVRQLRSHQIYDVRCCKILTLLSNSYVCIGLAFAEAKPQAKVIKHLRLPL